MAVRFLPADLAGAGGKRARFGLGGCQRAATAGADLGGRWRSLGLVAQSLAKQFGGERVPELEGQFFQVGEGSSPRRPGLAVEVEEQVFGSGLQGGLEGGGLGGGG